MISLRRASGPHATARSLPRVDVGPVAGRPDDLVGLKAEQTALLGGGREVEGVALHGVTDAAAGAGGGRRADLRGQEELGVGVSDPTLRKQEVKGHGQRRRGSQVGDGI